MRANRRTTANANKKQATMGGIATCFNRPTSKGASVTVDYRRRGLRGRVRS
jgi:hypothetical protein